MKKSKLQWNPVMPRPALPGHYLVWGKDRGMRLISTHPEWWNGQDPYQLGRIDFYAYLGPHEMILKLREMKKAHAKRASQRR